MSKSNPHEAHFREVLGALYKGNFEPFSAAISEDYVCHTPGRSILAGDYHGAEQTTVKRPKLRALCGGTFRVQAIGDMCIDGDWGMVPVRVTAEAGDAKLDTTAFGIWRFRGDRIVEHWEMNFDQRHFDDFIAAAAARA
jgi:hypothetical protein